MARGDGIDRTNVRNMRLTAAKIMNTQRHNERERDSYVNQDIVPEMSQYNVHFKRPSGSYAEMFEQMERKKIISTRGLKEDAFTFGELIFDVNSAYFYNHGGYEFAKQFYHDAYKSAIEIVGGEQYILSAVMHADERNRAMSEGLGEDIYHYHLHVVYVPVVEKQVLWTKRCKDKSLVGTVKETIMQVSMSKKWASKPAVDDVSGKMIVGKNGKPVLKKSYSVLQDDFFQAMQRAGYTDLQRGERSSSEEHLTVTQFKVEQENERLRQAQELSSAHLAAAEEYRRRKADMEQKAQLAQRKLNEIAPQVDDFERWAQQVSGELEMILPEVKG
ncbi:MAG: plasmid recombination protein, partial [Acutalibacter sp.]|nr:plasmid recombination protein [Acutalibacter sp.]